MKRKALIISVIAVSIALISLLLAPLLLKDKIFSIIKETANEKINAVVDFSDADVSLLRDFPRISVGVSNLSIANIPPSHDTLMRVSSVQLSLDLWTLITESRAEILAFHLERPHIFTHISADSSKNWNISKADDSTAKEKPKHIRLRDLSVKDGQLIFLDETGNKRFSMSGLSIDGSAEYKNNICALSATVSSVISFDKGKMTMLDSVFFHGKTSVEIDIDKQHYILKNNTFTMNELPVSIAGTMDLAEKYIDFDLNIQAASSDFGSFLSIVPKMPSKKEALRSATGKAALTAIIKGRMDDNNLPGFSLGIVVNDGAFQGKESPVAIRNVQMNLAVTNPDGKPDNTVVDLKNLTLTAGSDPFSMHATIWQPVSNPYIDAAIKGAVNLASWKNNLNMPNVSNLSGVIIADIAIKARKSDFSSGKMGRFPGSGAIEFQNIAMQSSTLPAPLSLRSMLLRFTPNSISISNLSGSIGRSDFQGEGEFLNLPAFMFGDKQLSASLRVHSQKFDCNPWLGVTTSDNKQKPSNVKPAEFPANIDFTFNASAGEVYYDNMVLRNVLANMRLRDKILSIENASMNAVGGSISMKGAYDTRIAAKPHSTLELSLKKIDFAEAYSAFGTVQAFAPFLSFMKGNFDANIHLNTILGEDLKPDYPTLSSMGGLNIERIAVEGLKPFTQVASMLKIDALTNPTLTQIASKFVIEKGKFNIPRTSLKYGGYDGAIQGASGLDKSIDYILTLNVPAASLSQKANQALSSLLKKEISAIGNVVPVNITFKGTIDNPQVSISLDNAAVSQLGSAAKVLQDEAQHKINEEKAKLEQRAKEEEQKLRQRASEEEQKLKQKIAEEQERLKKKVEEEAKKKAEELLKKSPLNPFRPR